MPAAITVAPVTVAESAGSAIFTATLDAASTSDVTLNYSTANGTAKAGSDYIKANSSVTIPAGQTSATFSIPVLADQVSGEGNERFYVNLKATGGNTVTARRVAATVVDSTTAPTITANDLTLVEPTSGSKKGSVTIALSHASAKAVKVSYTTLDDTASSSGSSREYQAKSGSVTIRAGATSARIPVTVYSRATADEDFAVVLRSATNATLSSILPGGIFSRVVIQDRALNGTRPTATVADTVVVAGNTATFTVSLSAASTVPVSFRYSTEAGTASTANYTPVDSILTIPAGQTTATISVPTTAAVTSTAGYGVFFLGLSSPANAVLASNLAGAVLINSQTSTNPAIVISAGTVTVGTSGTAVLPFTVTLAGANPQTVTVDYTTADGSAIAGTDYTATSGTLTFAPGVTTQTVNVTVSGESTTTASKTLSVVLSGETNAIVTANSATGVVTYSTGTPAVSVASPAVTVGTSGTGSLSFVVSLSAASANTVTVAYSTADGTAVAGTDYTATSGTLTFAAGTTSQTVTVPVAGETTSAASKTLTLNLTGATNTSNATASATGTINYTTASGQATVLSSNLTATSAGTEATTGTTYNAVSFTTGTSSYTLTAVDLLLAETVTGTATAAIYSSVTNEPASLIGTLTSPTSYSTTLADTQFTSSGGITLAANTTYWVVLAANSGTFNWSFAASDTGTGVGFTDSWAQTVTVGSSLNYFTYNSSPLQASITATATS